MPIMMESSPLQATLTAPSMMDDFLQIYSMIMMMWRMPESFLLWAS